MRAVECSALRKAPAPEPPTRSSIKTGVCIYVDLDGVYVDLPGVGLKGHLRYRGKGVVTE